MNILSEQEKNALKSKDKAYLSILTAIPEDEVEKLITILEKEAERVLESRLPPKTDYSVTISISRSKSHADVSVDVQVRGNVAYSKELENAILDAVNYVKKKLVEILEDISSELSRQSAETS